MKIGIVGAGQIVSEFHLRILTRLKGVSVVWLCDVDKSRALKLANDYSIPEVYDSVVECSEVDAIVVAVPVGRRRDVMGTAAARGWHAFCEKPFAVSLEEHERYLESARHRNVRLGVGYMRRFYHSTQTASNILTTGLLGNVLKVLASDCSELHRTGRSGRWYLEDPKQSGGGILHETGSHLIDQLFTVLKAEKVSIERCVQKRIAGLELETFARGSVEAFGNRFPLCFAVSRLISRFTGIQIDCERGSVLLGLSPGSEVIVTPARGLALSFRCPSAEEATVINAYERQFESFFDCVRRGDTEVSDFDTGLQTTQFIDSCTQHALEKSL